MWTLWVWSWASAVFRSYVLLRILEIIQDHTGLYSTIIRQTHLCLNLFSRQSEETSVTQFLTVRVCASLTHYWLCCKISVSLTVSHTHTHTPPTMLCCTDLSDLVMLQYCLCRFPVFWVRLSWRVGDLHLCLLGNHYHVSSHMILHLVQEALFQEGSSQALSHRYNQTYNQTVLLRYMCFFSKILSVCRSSFFTVWLEEKDWLTPLWKHLDPDTSRGIASYIRKQTAGPESTDGTLLSCGLFRGFNLG